jgi:hypothetical protein
MVRVPILDQARVPSALVLMIQSLKMMTANSKAVILPQKMGMVQVKRLKKNISMAPDLKTSLQKAVKTRLLASHLPLQKTLGQLQDLTRIKNPAAMVKAAAQVLNPQAGMILLKDMEDLRSQAFSLISSSPKPPGRLVLPGGCLFLKSLTPGQVCCKLIIDA